jgi:DNA-binding transcriptional LysR family regulator
MKRKTSDSTAAIPAVSLVQKLTALEPTPTDLAAFVRTVETGSLSAVARERDVPVSNVSRAIDRLESGYQVRLLNRSTHGLSVTPEGEVLVVYGRQVIAALEDASAALASRIGTASGLVRLSVSQTFASRKLLPSLPAFLAKYPQLRVEVLAEDRAVDLASEGIDLAIRSNAVGNDSLVARKIGEFGRALFAAPSYIERFGMPQHPDELHQHRCITHASSGILNRWRFQIDRRVHTVAVDGFHRANNTELAIQMVIAGLGIGQINTAMIGDAFARGDLVPVLEAFHNSQTLPIFVVMLPDRHRLPKIRVMIEHIQKVFR